MPMRALLLAAAVALVAAGCGGDDDDGGAGDAAATTTAAADIRLADTDLGEILVDADGRSLYLFVPDGQGESTCYDTCAENWPPVPAAASVGDGLDAGLLGTTERTDGTTQATYDGWPLYLFAGDAAAGDTNGQGLNDVWYVLDAAGQAVTSSG